MSRAPEIGDKESDIRALFNNKNHYTERSNETLPVLQKGVFDF
jgi:hypothetical protein